MRCVVHRQDFPGTAFGCGGVEASRSALTALWAIPTSPSACASGTPGHSASPAAHAVDVLIGDGQWSLDSAAAHPRGPR